MLETIYWFWRARDTITGDERKFITKRLGIVTPAGMAEWVRRFFQNLELVGAPEPYNPKEHGEITHPVAAHNVARMVYDETTGAWRAPRPMGKPEPKRRSVFITGRSIFRR